MFEQMFIVDVFVWIGISIGAVALIAIVHEIVEKRKK